MRNRYEPAFPHVDAEAGSLPDGDFLRPGLTKREYIAAMTMQGLLSASQILERHGLVYRATAKNAVECADALLAELAKDPKS